MKYLFFSYFFCMFVKINKMAKTIAISDDLYNEISEYCKLNKVTVKDFSEKALKDTLMLEKYGDIPFGGFKELPKEKEPEHIVAVDPTSGESKTVVTVIDTKEEKIVEQQEVKTEEEVEKIVEKYEEKPKSQPKPRVRRLK